MEELIEDYLESRQKYLAPRTRIEYKSDLKWFETWLKKQRQKTLLTANKSDISDYIDVVRVGKRATRRKFSVIRMFYLYLWNKDMIPSNPAEKITKEIKLSKRNPRFLSDSLMESVFSYCSNDLLLNSVVRTFYYTGIRLDELVNLTKSNIDFEKRQLTVIGKGDKQRTIPFSISLKEQLNEYLSSRGSNSHRLFVYRDGSDITSSQVEYMFTMMKKHIGFHIRPHLLRHTFASNALARGMTLAEVQYMLGHEQVSTTSIYVHVTSETKEAYDRAFR